MSDDRAYETAVDIRAMALTLMHEYRSIHDSLLSLAGLTDELYQYRRYMPQVDTALEAMRGVNAKMTGYEQAIRALDALAAATGGKEK